MTGQYDVKQEARRLLRVFADDIEAMAESENPPDLRAQYPRYKNRYEQEMRRIQHARLISDQLSSNTQAQKPHSKGKHV